MSILEIRNVRYRPPHSTESVFPRLSLSLEMDDMTVLIGESGTGKTTLGMLLAGGVEPDQGEILVDGAPSEHLPDLVGFLHQNPENQIIGTTVQKDVVYGLENRGIRVSEMKKRARHALEMFRLLPLRERPVNWLSGGEMQRTALAGLLATDARYLILDEPTSFLDIPGQNMLYQIVRELKSRGIGILWITQYPGESSLGDRVVVLGRGGRIREDAGTKETGMGQTEKSDRITVARESSPEQSPPVLSVPELNYRYPAESGENFRLTVREYSLRPGEIQGWYGYTGSGKSTFARILAGIVTPGEGTVRRSTGVQDIIYVPQFAERLLYNGTLDETLPLFRERKDFDEAAYREHLAAELEAMEIPGTAPFQRPIWSFSGGEQRRIVLAVAAAFRPKVCILDEPTIGVSPGDRRKIEQLFTFRKIRTIICISHEYGFLTDVCRQGVYFHEGAVSGPMPWTSLEQQYTYLTESEVPKSPSRMRHHYQPL